MTRGKGRDVNLEQERIEMASIKWNTDAELFEMARIAAFNDDSIAKDSTEVYQCPLKCCRRNFDRKYVRMPSKRTSKSQGWHLMAS